MLEPTCELTTILVSYNTRHLLDECLRALRVATQSLSSSQIIVVDNASRDLSADYLADRYPEIELIRSPANVGFGRANNLALARTSGKFVLLLNTDAFVEPEVISRTLAFMASHEDCGIVGVRLIGRDGIEQPSSRRFPTPWNIFLKRSGFHRFFPKVALVDGPRFVPPSAESCDWVPGCYYLIRREVIEQVGLFDPKYFLYFEEVDHCFAAKQRGWKVYCDPASTVVHIGGESAKSDGPVSAEGRQVGTLEIESALLFFRKNHGLEAVLLHVLLDAAADLIIALRCLKSPAHNDSFGFRWRRISSTLALCWRTSFGSVSTR